MKKIERMLIFIYGKDKKTRLKRILFTFVVVAFVLLMLFGVTIDLGFFKITPVADININR